MTHSGNYAGDRSKGFKTHSLGCILLGKYSGNLSKKQRAVLCSKPTMSKFINIMPDKFKLHISEVF